MFTKKSSTNKAGIETAIDNLLEEMSGLPGDSSDYARCNEQLTKLHALKTAESPKTLDPNQLFAVAGQLAGILMIIHHEQVGIVTTKALTFIPKLK